MKKFLFNKDENNHFENLFNNDDNRDYLFTWSLVNLLIPTFIVILTIVIVGLQCYINHKPISSDEFFYTLYNGGLPLVGINILLLGLFSWIKYDKQKEEKYANIPNLRTKLTSYFVILFIIGLTLYGTQATLAPIENNNIKWLEGVGSVFLIVFAWLLTRRVILLEEEPFNKVYSPNYKGERHLVESNLATTLLLKRN